MANLFPFQIEMLVEPISWFCLWKCGSITRNSDDYVLAEHNQEGSGSQGHVSRELKTYEKTKYQQTFIPQTGRVAGHAHKLEDALNLGIMTFQVAGAHMLDSSHNIPDS